MRHRLRYSIGAGALALGFVVWALDAYLRAAENEEKGTLVVTDSDHAVMIEILSDDPTDDQNLEAADRNFYEKVGARFRSSEPAWRSWGTEATSARPLVGTLPLSPGEERTVRLKPGTYHLAAHLKSPCGYYGGTIRRTVEVKRGERTEGAVRPN